MDQINNGKLQFGEKLEFYQLDKSILTGYFVNSTWGVFGDPNSIVFGYTDTPVKSTMELELDKVKYVVDPVRVRRLSN